MENNNSMVHRRLKDSGLYVKSYVASCAVAAICNAVGSHRGKSAALKARRLSASIVCFTRGCSLHEAPNEEGQQQETLMSMLCRIPRRVCYWCELTVTKD